MSSQGGDEKDDEPMLGFMFGNVDEGNQVDADYLDEKALLHLSGLSKLQGGFALQSVIIDEDVDLQKAADEQAPEPIQFAPDAQDFADETEEIDDVSAPPSNLNAVDTALAATTGTAAEDEDYDFDTEEQQTLPITSQQQHQQKQSAPPTISSPDHNLPLQLLTPEDQKTAAKSLGIDLPFLGQLNNGNVVLAFTDLMAPLIDTTAEEEEALQQRLLYEHADDGSIITTKKPIFNPSTALMDAPPAPAPTELDGDIFLTATPQELVDRGFQLRKMAADKDGCILETIHVIEHCADEDDDHLAGADRNLVDQDAAVDASMITVSMGDMQDTTTAMQRGDGNENYNEEEKESKKKTEENLDSTTKELASIPVLGDGSMDQEKAHRVKSSRTKNSSIDFPVLPECVFYPAINSNWEAISAWRKQQQRQEQQIVEEEKKDILIEGEEINVDHHALQQPEQECEAKTASIHNITNDIPTVQVSEIPEPDLDPAWKQLTPPTTADDDTSVDIDTDTMMHLFPEAPLLQYVLQNTQQPTTQTLPLPLSSRAFAWENKVPLDRSPSATAEALRALPIVFDLNDPQLILEQTQKQVPIDQAMLGHSSAIVVPMRQQKSHHTNATAAAAAPGTTADVDISDEAEMELDKLNKQLSNDKVYFAGPRRKGAVRLGRAVHHAKMALQLATIPIPVHTDFSTWHRPRGIWWPVAGFGKQYQWGRSVGATTGTLSTMYADVSFKLGENSRDMRGVILSEEWRSKLRKPLLLSAKNKPLPLFLLPGEGTQAPSTIDPDVPLGDQSYAKLKKVNIVTAYTEADLYPTDKAEEAHPEVLNKALLRPPMAFKLNKELKAANRGRVIIVEFLEESPMLLNRPGMGARLTTYYRRADLKDTTLQQRMQEAIKEDERWRIGKLYHLDDDDESPFLGELLPGQPQLAVETGVFTAIAHPYKSQNSDFLLTRSTAGVMRVREITGTVLTGQELPLHRIPPPGSRDLKDLQERRIFVYVFRTFRRLIDMGRPPVVELDVVTSLFPDRPKNMIRIFFKDQCGLRLENKGNAKELYTLKENVRMPSEAELRKKFSPEEACVLEATFAAVQRLNIRGIHRNQDFGFVAPEKLRLAAEMLSDDPEVQLAAKAVEHALQTAPWSLTDAFLASFRESRATMRLHGPGDPTGRGVGYSFIRDVRHKSVGGAAGGGGGGATGAGGGTQGAGGREDPLHPGQVKGSKLQGTDADLRRMTTEQAKQKLMSFGMLEEEVEPMRRWARIDLVRQLANAAAADGVAEGIDKYVRHERTTLIELQKRYRERAQVILEKQMNVINDTADDDLGDQGGLDEELEGELEDAVDEGAEAEGAAKGKQARASSPSLEEEMKEMEAMRAAGLLGSSPHPPTTTTTTAAAAAAIAGGGSSLDAAGPSTTTTTTTVPMHDPSSGIDGPLIPGQTRRIRREVWQRDPLEKAFVKIKEIIYSGRVKPYMLASLYSRPDGSMAPPWNFGSRTITYKKDNDGKLGYNAARGRGRGRARGRHRGGRRGRDPGRKPYKNYSKHFVDDDTRALAHGPATNRPKRARGENILVQAEKMNTEDSDGDDYMDDDEVFYDEDGNEFIKTKQPKPKPAPRDPNAPKKPRPKPKPKPVKQLDEFGGEEKPPQELIALQPIADYANPDEINEAIGSESEEEGKQDDGPGSDSDYSAMNDGSRPDDDEECDDHDGDYEDDNGSSRKRKQRGVSRGKKSAHRQQYQQQPTRTSRRSGARKGKKRKYDESEEEYEENDGSEEEDEEDAYYANQRQKKTRRAPPPIREVQPPPARAKKPKTLGSIIISVIKQMEKEGKEHYKKTEKLSFWGAFYYQINKALIKDYNEYIPLEQERCLYNAEKKAKANKYTTVDQFLDDVKQMIDNAVTYHSSGKYAEPFFMSFAPQMLPYVEQLLAARKKEINDVLGIVDDDEVHPGVKDSVLPLYSAPIPVSAPVPAAPAIKLKLRLPQQFSQP